MLASEILRRLTMTGVNDVTAIAALIADGAIEAIGGHVPTTFESGDISLTATSTNNLIVPARSGFYFVPVPSSNGFRLRVMSTAGTKSTDATINIGNNVAKTNYFPSGTPNLTTPFNAGARSTFTLGGGPNIVMEDLAAPIQLDVTSAATGSGLSFVVRVSLTGYYVAV